MNKRLMAARKKSKTVKPSAKHQNNIVILAALLLIIDGFIRLFFSSTMFYVLPALYQNTDLYFHLRWFGIGAIELLFAWGILKHKLWALYGLLGLSIIRIYTVIVFPPQGLITPISSNWVTYSLKIIVAGLFIYLFGNRKKLKFS